MKVSSLEEAARLQGTDTVLDARVTGVLQGDWGWTVDIGVPAVLVMRGRRCGPNDDRSSLVGQDVECVVVEVDLERKRMVVAPALGSGRTPRSATAAERSSPVCSWGTYVRDACTRSYPSVRSSTSGACTVCSM